MTGIRWLIFKEAENSAAVISLPFGKLGIYGDDRVVTHLQYLPREVPEQAPATPLLKEACDQIKAYLDEPRQVFDLPLQLKGSAYSQRVWRGLLAIEPGQTITYGELAKKLGSAPRAIGLACRANDYPIIVPCHRVVARDGLGGYGGETQGSALDIKRWLLHHEGANYRRWTIAAL